MNSKITFDSPLDWQYFVKHWKNTVNESDKLYLSYLLINITELILNASKKNGYDANLIDSIKYLSYYLKNDKFILNRIISSIDPNIIHSLVVLVDAQDLEFKKVNPLIKSIHSILCGDQYLNATKEFFQKNEVIEIEEYIIVIDNLIRSLSKRFSLKSLEFLPQKVIAKYIVDIRLSDLDFAKVNSDTIKEGIQAFTNDLYQKLTGKISPIKNENNDQRFLQNIFERPHNWLSTCESIYDLFSKEVQKRVSTNNEIKVDNQLLIQIVKKIHDTLIWNFIEEFTPAGSNRRVLSQRYFQEYAKIITSHIKTDRINFERILMERSFLIFSNLLWTKIASKLDQILINERSSLQCLLYNETVVKKNTITDFQLYANIMNHIKEMTNRIFLPICKEIMDLENIIITPEYLLELYNRFKESLYNYNNFESLIASYPNIPINSKVLDNLFDEFIKPEKEIEIFYVIGKMNMEYQKLELTSNILLYDSRMFYFGENYNLDNISTADKDIQNTSFESDYLQYYSGNHHSLPQRTLTDINFKRNSCRALVKVKALDIDKAVEIGLKDLLNALSMISFMTSKSGAINKPQILNNCFIRDLRHCEKYFRWNIIQNNRIESFAYDTKRKEILNNLISRVNISTINVELNNSISLFSIGVLTSNIYLKFSTFWTALEQLIEPFSHNDKDVDIITHLSITWRNIHSHWIIDSYVKSIRSKIKLDSSLVSILNRECSKWDKFDYILLENLGKIKKHTENPDIINAVKNYQDWLHKREVDEEYPEVNPISNQEKILNEIVVLKVIQKQKISIIYSTRNQIFHEGHVHIEGLDYLTRFLEDTLFSIIINFLTIESLQRKNRLHKIVIELNRPFKDFALCKPIKFSNILFEQEGDQF